MHSEPIHLVIAINQKYIRYAYVMLTSLLLHTSCDVHVYVLHRELNAADQQTFDTLTHSYPVTFHFIQLNFYLADCLCTEVLIADNLRFFDAF